MPLIAHEKDAMSEYPEHEKMKAAIEELGTQKIGQFLDWLDSEGIRLAKYHEHTASCLEVDDRSESRVCGTYDQELRVHRESFRDLLARYAEIDQKKIDAEKDAMIDAERQRHTARKAD